jgi:hypothetical protein
VYSPDFLASAFQIPFSERIVNGESFQRSHRQGTLTGNTKSKERAKLYIIIERGRCRPSAIIHRCGITNQFKNAPINGTMMSCVGAAVRIIAADWVSFAECTPDGSERG